MWWLVKAELQYHRMSLGILLVCFTGLCFSGLISGWESLLIDIPGITIIAFTGALVVNFIRQASLCSEKLDRRITLLPVAVKQLAISRILFPIATWLALMTVLHCVVLLVRPVEFDLRKVFAILSITGLFFMANAFFLVHRDLTFRFTGGAHILIHNLLSTLAMFFGTILMLLLFASSSSQTGTGLSFKILGPMLKLLPEPFVGFAGTPVSALAFLAAAAIAVSLSVSTFENRTNYVE